MREYVRQRLKELGVAPIPKPVDIERREAAKALHERYVKAQLESAARKKALRKARYQNRLNRSLYEPPKLPGNPTPQGLGHTAPQATYKIALKTGTCAYCGQTASGFDHVIPYIYSGKSGQRRGSSDSGLRVECCKECNMFLGKALIPTVVDRAAFLTRKAKVRIRYSKDRWNHLSSVARLG